jgi:hypothetical protein
VHYSTILTEVTPVLIAPVATQTKGGYPAEVTGIDPTDHDYLIGTIDRPGLGKIGVDVE